MKSLVMTRHGDINVLKVESSTDPEPKAGEVRIRVKFAGINFADLSARVGLYPDAPKTPCVMGYEVSGVVDALGAGVTDLAVGSRVFALTRFGGQADTVCVPAQQAVVMPDNMSFEEGAAIPVNYVTAYHMLFYVGQIRPGHSVLVHMAAGGVGLAVLQLCRTVPDVTVFGTSSASKHAILREQGCTHPIDYHTADYVAEVKRITEGRGVDLVLDALGGADLKKGYGLLRTTGRLIAFGMANMHSGGKRSIFRAASTLLSVPRFHPLTLMNDNRSVSGVNLGHLWGEVPLMRTEMQALVELYRAGKIKPHVDSVFPLERAGEAHRRIESRGNVGKVLLSM